MANVLVSESDWQNLSGDDQSGIMNAVSQSFGYDVASSGSGVSLSAMDSANTATPTGSNPNCDDDCATLKNNCLSICEGMRDPKAHDACVTTCWASYGICLLECAVGI